MSGIRKTRVNLREAGFRTTSAKSAKSPSVIAPGDLIFFSYRPMSRPTAESVPYLCLVVSNKRSQGNSMFRAKSGTKLLSAFDISSASEEVVSLVLKRIYKNRQKCSYSKIVNGLKTIFGAESYKTFNVLNVTELYEIFIVDEDGE